MMKVQQKQKVTTPQMMKDHTNINPQGNILFKLRQIFCLAAVFTLLLPVFWTAPVNAEEVNVYSYRQSNLIEPILKSFTKETGIKVNLLYADKGLEERIRIEGKRSPADVFLTTDTTALERLKKQNSAAKLPELEIMAKIPDNLKDPDDYWVGLTMRARVLYLSKKNMPKSQIDSYLALGDKKYKGKICMRSGLHPYNLGLISAMIRHYGEKKTEEWLKKLKRNLARKPQGNDRAQVKAVKEGQCDIALGNSYYFGLMVYNEIEPDQKQWAAAVNPVFPSEEYGTHVNISGFALVKTAPNKKNALKLLEYLLSQSAQREYAELNYEFPAVTGVAKGEKLTALFPDNFKQDSLNLVSITDIIPIAVDMVNRLDFDN